MGSSSSIVPARGLDHRQDAGLEGLGHVGPRILDDGQIRVILTSVMEHKRINRGLPIGYFLSQPIAGVGIVDSGWLAGQRNVNPLTEGSSPSPVTWDNSVYNSVLVDLDLALEQIARASVV
jgi:hypothetical protein